MRQVCLQSHQTHFHSRQIYGEYLPNLINDNPVIPVHQHVTQASDLMPRNVRLPLANRRGNVLCGLTYNNQTTEHRILQKRVSLKSICVHAGYVTLDSLNARQHILHE